MRGARWKAIGVLLVVGLPHASCSAQTGDCGIQDAPHGKYVPVAGGCGEYCSLACDPGFLDCDTDPNNGCETPAERPDLHENVEVTQDSGGCSEPSPEEVIGNCSANCAPGFSDCDGLKSNGCETAGDCAPDAGHAPDGGAPQEIATLLGEPLGLAICGGSVVYFDGSTLMSVEPNGFASAALLEAPATPAGGIACDASYAYFATASTAGDGGPPNGALFATMLAAPFPEEIANGLDPAPGIALRDGDVYFLAASGLERVAVGGDGGAATWMPASPTGVDSPFALAPGADWSIASGQVLVRPADAGASSVFLDAGGASALFTSEAGAPFAILHASPDAGQDLVASITDDAGAPAVGDFATSVDPVVATTTGSDVIVVASAGKIYAVSLATRSIATIATASAPVAQVARDDTWAYWTTRAKGGALAGIFRAKLP